MNIQQKCFIGILSIILLCIIIGLFDPIRALIIAAIIILFIGIVFIFIGLVLIYQTLADY